ncbi:MAG: hypothetical protein ABIN20_08290 [candidate division WOR-3 bacterium]
MKKILFISILFLFIFCGEEKINYPPLGDEFEEVWKAKDIGKEKEINYIIPSNIYEEIFYFVVLEDYEYKHNSYIYKFDFKNENLEKIGDLPYCYTPFSLSFRFPEKILTFNKDSVYILNIENGEIKKIKIPYLPRFISFSPFDSLQFFIICGILLISSYNFLSFDTIFHFSSNVYYLFITKRGDIFAVSENEILFSGDSGKTFNTIYNMPFKKVTFDVDGNVYIIKDNSVLKLSNGNLIYEINLPFELNFYSFTAGKDLFISNFINNELRVYKLKNDKFLDISFGIKYTLADSQIRHLILKGDSKYYLMYAGSSYGNHILYFIDSEFPP